MRLLLSVILVGWVFCVPAGAGAPVKAPEDRGVRATLVKAILSNGTERQRFLREVADSGSAVATAVLAAWTLDNVFLYKSPDGSTVPVILEDQQDANGKARAIRIMDGRFLKDAGGKELRFSNTDLPAASTDMRLRRSIQQTLNMLALANPDQDARRSAVTRLGNSQNLKYVGILKARLRKEPDAEVRKTIRQAIALLQLGDRDPAVQIAAANQLAALNSIGSVDALKRLAGTPHGDHQVMAAAKRALMAVEDHIWWVNLCDTVFEGVSLGSILLVVALGLAITFGLMGVINMAHGEMIGVGAYTCYVVQNVFGAGFAFSITLPFSLAGKPITFGLHLPGLNATGWLYQSYFALSIPLSFLTAALAGLVLERTVIRFLYRRPLESLLATWGVSLVMQQLFRMVFGANNVQVNSPSWLLGHISVNDVVFDFNRLFVIAFAALIVVGTWFLLSRTPLGLLIRGVMQNRDMAACMGVRTHWVNMLTFAFGSGLAGLAGAFLSQIGNVGPSLGQTYIVDSFMIVVAGGVGSIAGTVYSALGIGSADQVLQQLLGSPVIGRILVLGAIILFLQWKPGGLFSMRSRSLD